MCINQNVRRIYKYDKKLRSCVPKRGFVYAYPFFGRPKDTSNQTGQNAQGSNGQNGNGQTGNGTETVLVMVMVTVLVVVTDRTLVKHI